MRPAFERSMRRANRHLGAACACLAAGAATGPAHAQDSAALRVRSLAATCAQCHGTDGRAPADSVVPGLAGVPAPTLIEQMSEFRSGTRPATVMAQLARGFNDAQVRELAAYFAAQPR